MGKKVNNSSYINQLLPIILTAISALALIFLLYLEIRLLNIIIPKDIYLKIKPQDVLVGLTIYLKTSIDFAIFIGNLMSNYKGVKNRIAIELGTAFGNALGTILVLAIWDFFKEIKILLAFMIIVAALVLLRLAEESLEHISSEEEGARSRLEKLADQINDILSPINKFFHKGLKLIIPNLSMKPKKNLNFWALVGLSLTIPFILGLDDFAGYVPIFSIVNVFGFSIGVILGHMLLNIFLFLSPSITIRVVKNSVVSVLGSIAFIGLAIWGFWEVCKLLILSN